MNDPRVNKQHLKVGDKVQLVKNEAYSFNNIGDKGRIISIYSHGQFCEVDCGKGYMINIDSYWGDLVKIMPELNINIKIL
jgi:hypothetical protein